MRMSGARLSTWLFLWLSVPVVTAGQTPSQIPQEIPGRNQMRTAPIWVAAEKAAEEPDREDLFSPANRISLRHRQQTPALPHKGGETRPGSLFSLITEDACSEFSAGLEIERPDTKPHWSYADVAENAGSILAGRIDSIAVGFLDGTPGSLLRIDVSREIRRSGELAAGRYLYLYYPRAAFQIFGQTHCARNADFSHLPQVGEGVLIFNFYPPLDADGRLIYTHAEGVFFESLSGSLVIPKRLRQQARMLPANSLDGILEDLQARQP